MTDPLTIEEMAERMRATRTAFGSESQAKITEIAQTLTEIAKTGRTNALVKRTRIEFQNLPTVGHEPMGAKFVALPFVEFSVDMSQLKIAATRGLIAPTYLINNEDESRQVPASDRGEKTLYSLESLDAELVTKLVVEHLQACTEAFLRRKAQGA